MLNTNSSSANTALDSAAPGASNPSLSRPVTLLLLLGLAGALVAPIWSVRYPPILDYPNHLASAYVLAHLKDPTYQFGQFYGADWNTYPYLAMDAILVGLQQIMSIDMAGRVLLSLCVLSVPAAAWFFLSRANPGEQNLAFWSLLISNNLYFLIYGFLNQQLSLAICFLLLGMWLWHLNRPRIGTWCLLLLVTTALYLSHLEGFAVAAVVMTVYAWSAQRPIKFMVSAWALFVPGALFYLHIVLAGHGTQGALQFRNLPDKLGSLTAVMIGCNPAVDFLTLLVLLGVLVWAQIDNPDFQWNRPWRRATLVLFLFYWLLPAAFGRATNADKRLLPFIFVLSLAGTKVGRRGAKLAVVAVLLFFLRAGALEWHSVSLRPHFAKLAGSISVIPAGARVLPLVDWAGGAPYPERHFWAYGVIERGWFSPCLLHFPGIQPFAIRLRTYNPCALPITSTTELDWGRVESDFDYVWAYHVPQFSSALSSMGTVAYQEGELQVFRINKPVIILIPQSP